MSQSSFRKGQSTECIIHIKEKLRSWKKRPVSWSIFKVPYELRKVNEEAYSPRIVSIGPFHARTGTGNRSCLWLAKEDEKRDQLLVTKEHKWGYMQDFLDKTEDPMRTLEEFGIAIKDLEESVHDSYVETNNFGSDELVEMMLVDGCFLLQLFIKSWFKDNPYKKDFLPWFQDDMYDGDPIFHNSWMRPIVRQDLALLENQIPFLVLQKLYDIFLKQPFSQKIPFDQRKKFPTLTQLVLSFFRPDLKLNKHLTNQEDWGSEHGQNFEHLLDFLHKFYFPTACTEDPSPATAKDNTLTQGFRECATKLLRAGIEFEKALVVNFVDITFENKTGDIKIPQLRIDASTESILRNLIAFEQCGPRSRHHVSSYVILMKSLINSSKDINLLRKREIITDNLGGNENVSNFFKDILIGVVLEDFCFGPLCKKVNEHRQSWWHRRRIKGFFKGYFSTRWSLATFNAGLLILILTGLQTFYTIYSYYKQKPH